MTTYIKTYSDIIAKSKILIHQNEIRERVKTMAKEIERDMNWRNFNVAVILNSGAAFAKDIIEEFGTSVDPYYIDFTRHREFTYDEFKTRLKNLNIERDIPLLLIDVLFDDDAVLNSFTEGLRTELNIEAIKTAVLLLKNRDTKPSPDYVGFSISERMVFGYGIGCGGLWKNLPDIRTYY